MFNSVENTKSIKTISPSRLYTPSSITTFKWKKGTINWTRKLDY